VVPSEESRMAEVLLRIARTRGDLAEFVGVQVGAFTRARVEGQGA
jgi:hypothetical protein